MTENQSFDNADFAVSIHTPTKGVTIRCPPFLRFQRRFNPHTHEGCDSDSFSQWYVQICFNPHTHEGCDRPTTGTGLLQRGFNPHTHEGCDLSVANLLHVCSSFNPHTHEGCDLGDFLWLIGAKFVSIHTPTKGVTYYVYQKDRQAKFQSTHPRRV